MQPFAVSSPIIDIHRHIAHPGLMKNLASLPRDVFVEHLSAQKEAVYNLPAESTDIDVQVQEQDRVGITKGVLSNAFPLADLKPDVGSVAQDIAKIVNDDLATVVSTYPDKLNFLATVHPFEPGFAQEIDRGLKSLGAKGLTLTSSYAGRWLDAPLLNPFWEYVQSRDVAVFLHPPITPTWLPFSDVYPLQEMVYRPFDVMTTMTRMIFSGLFDRYPHLKIVLPFGGAGIMNLLGRLDYSYRSIVTSSSSKEAAICQRPPSSYMKTNMYVEVGMSFSPTTIQQAIQVFGSDRVLFGTDYPIAPIEEQLMLVKQLNLNPTEQEQILWKNSRDLFHLDVPASALNPQLARR